MQISFDRLFAKNLQFIFAKLVQFVSLCQRLSKKLNLIKIWQVEVGQNKDLVCYRKKQSFRQCAWGLRQLVLKPGFRPNGRALGMREKSENFNSLSYVKKTTGNRVNSDLQKSIDRNYNKWNWIFFYEKKRNILNLLDFVYLKLSMCESERFSGS